MERKPVFRNKLAHLIQSFAFLALTLFISVSAKDVFAAAHTVERGETALQIAIDHDLTMEQLSQLNPGTDLEMMRVGDILVVPDKGTSFDDFLDSRYSKMLRIGEPVCTAAADRHAVCLYSVENISEFPLYDIRFKISVQGKNGARGEAESGFPLIQILPGEKIPVCSEIQGYFDEVSGASVKTAGLVWSELYSSSFRIPEDMFAESVSIFPDGIGADASIRFTADGAAAYRGKKINVLAAAYTEDGSLTGVRSLYTDLYPLIGITVYSVGREIHTVRLWLEAY